MPALGPGAGILSISLGLAWYFRGWRILIGETNLPVVVFIYLFFITCDGYYHPVDNI